ncbi:MAG: nitroreductase family protein [Candidatus Diapherotrites archaeon]|nr:nitroreductase family protein [Candidatus Diapherotrites archaeon]
MELDKAIKTRRTIRSFSRAANREEIRGIIEAALYAPSAMNSQPWEFVVIERQEKKAKIRGLYDKARNLLGIYRQDSEFIEKGTIVIIVSPKEVKNARISCAFALQNMLLKATELKLSGVILGVLNSEKIERELAEIIKLPSNKKISFVAVFGKPNKRPTEKEIKSLERIIHFDVF